MSTTSRPPRTLACERSGKPSGISLFCLCDGCSPGLLRMYEDYIEGRKELREINAEFRARYLSGAAGPDKRGCGYME